MSSKQSAKSAKRDKTDIKSAAELARQRLAASALRPKQSKSPSSIGRNTYLDAIVNPLEAPAPSIPDGSTLPSTKFKTTYVDTVKTDSDGRFLAFHTPTLDFGGFHPALFPTSSGVFISAVDPNSPVVVASGAVSTNYEVHDVIPAPIKESILRNFAAIRPVGMVIEAVPIASALNAKGFVTAGLISTEQLPASIGAIPGVPLLPATYTPSNTIQDNSVSLLSDLVSGAGYIADTLKPVNVVWRPEDGRSLTYRNTATSQNSAYTSLAAGGFYAGPPSARALHPETSQVMPVYLSDSQGTPDTVLWWVPGGMAFAAQPITTFVGLGNAPFSTVLRPTEDYAYPSVWFCVEGATASTAVFEIKITISWEALPISAQRSVIASTPSPSNPDELTQAANIIPMLPVAYDPDNSSQPENKIVTAAKTASPALYDGTPRKSALEGSSWVGRIANIAGKVSGILPFPLSALVSGASSLIGALTSK